MIRVGFFSSDAKLHQLVASALGVEFKLLLERTEHGLAAMVEDGECDVVIYELDSMQSELEGRIAFVRTMLDTIPSIILADDPLRGTAGELVRSGAHSCCRKPPSIRDLKLMLRRAYEVRPIDTRRTSPLPSRVSVPAPTPAALAPATLPSCGEIVGASPQMRELYDMVRRVTDLNASVLIAGESGTGKELVARAIHQCGARAAEPFVAVSCGAIPETLIESELFGHEKGAFTGTVGAREGYLEKAAAGTLFLDEIGELSPATQVKLLRVLQQREFNRLGSSRNIPLRARVLFATHADLSSLVSQGKFRLDLFYRINVVRVEVPALQDRAEDIPLLAQHFLARYSEVFAKRVDSIAPDALRDLQSYTWPGNVRELENVIQRAIILASDATIYARDLPPELRREAGVIEIEDYRSPDSFAGRLRDYKLKLAETAVKEHHGNKTMAARSLKISRAYLHRLLRSADQDDLLETHALTMETA
jgi:DNA-binding NtrC family response regulator